ncbi:hypothetical protein LSTR_LSTR014762 [Laodelphax striatellus]|uniref:Nuclear pore localisation protein Npl4 ubiquitin-like domain-containing protein n=1 Tax=Laodelphax striatellus TaxID=195883 RepID=A0A482XZ71_LAOST|nr:hypothetical protein LSTR_LSTR014762 [Laodelphax striatellus]
MNFEIIFQVHDVFSLSGFAFSLFRERNSKDELISSRSRTVSAYGLKHGDMIYLAPLNGAMLWDNPRPSTSSSMDGASTSNSHYSRPSTSMSADRPSHSSGVQGRQSSLPYLEDEVDQILWKQDGKVQRKRDEKL